MGNIKIARTSLAEIAYMREQFLHENHFQFTYNKCHDYGWADTYLISDDEMKIGYGAVWGSDDRHARDSIFEYYLLQPFRFLNVVIFQKLIVASGALFIESQSNDHLLTGMLYEFTNMVHAEAILFEESSSTAWTADGTVFRKVRETDPMGYDNSDYVLDQDGKIVGSGGLMLNYNYPYADLYMQVHENYRQQGLGAFLVQELKKEAYLIGRVPAARCNIDNTISRKTLLKAGLSICGYRLKGTIRPEKSAL